MQQPQEDQNKPAMKDGFNFISIFMRSHATAVSIWLRRDYGQEGIGIAGLGGAILIAAWGSYTGDILMYYYLLAFIAAVILQRMKTFQNWRRGFHQHSYYQGYPWFAFKLFPKITKEGNAKAVEAFLCLGIGGLLCNIGIVSIGAFLVFGFVSILFTEGMKQELTNKRVRAMRDAQLEQQYLQDAFQQKDNFNL